MAKFPIGKGPQGRNTQDRSTQSKNAQSRNAGRINLDALTKKARYIVDENGRRHAVVVDYAAWQNFLRQMGESGAASGSSAGEPEYALRHDQANGDLYRPQPARGKEAADFTLETNVTRRGG